ncbi:WSC domain-containing protein [Seiridium cupressi]
MTYYSKAMLGLLAAAAISPVHGFWRMTCGTIQTGRIDPIISPGNVAGHVHKVSGASNFYFNNTFADLSASSCTSCEIQDDKSAYWTPQLYYQHSNGTFQEVPNGGHVVYYLGRGDNRSAIEPFPSGFKMISGDTTARSNGTTTMTYNSTTVRGRLQSDRVSFACLDSSGPMAEQNYMFRTDCNQGLRAQIQFQSCWDGRDYQSDNSHVAYMSQIDNGVCPPTHPRILPHLFFEVLYGVNNINKTAGGRFVFANGDTTGFGFHGDFMNGWNAATLASAVTQCVNNDNINGQISLCPPLAKSQTPYASTNCPERAPLVNEAVHGFLDKLPGCNNVTSGPARAIPSTCPTRPSMNSAPQSLGQTMFAPTVGTKLSASSSWAYAGCAAEGNGQRTLASYSFSADNMTIDYCTATCKTKGYSLAGVEYSRECYCASALSSGTSFMASANCSSTPKMICAGNATQWCGAPSFLNIWNNTSFSATQPSAGAAGGTATYNGCYSEVSGRLLNNASYANSSVTVDQCAAYCQAGNYAFIGLEYSGECYCGNTPPPKSQAAAESSCNMPCKGNPSEICGGSSRVSVYNNTLYTPTRNVAMVKVNNKSAYNYVACYKEGTSGRALANGANTSSAQMTVESCAAFCVGKGYNYMGVEYGQECYCNNDGLVNGAVKANETDCSMTCSGNGTEWCGAASRINVYKSTALKKRFFKRRPL